MTVTRSTAAKAKRIGRAPVALAAVALTIVLAGCGSSSSGTTASTTESTSTPATTASTTASTPAATTSTSTSTSAAAAPASGSSTPLTLAANTEGQLKYNKTALTAQAGKVSIDFTNMSPVGHNLTIESSAGTTIGATPTFQGATKTLTLDLKAGTYKFFCSVPGHRMAGMEGTLTVK